MKTKSWKNSAELLVYLNKTYARLHTAYEDAFWKAYMGDHTFNELKDKALAARDAFRNDENIKATVESRYAKEKGTLKERLGHWKHFFSLYQTPTEAKALKERIAKLETIIETKRAKRKEGYIDPVTKNFIKAPSNKMRSLIATHADERIRKACFEALQDLAGHSVLTEYVELVGLRNQFARLLGYGDFYAYKLAVEEGMTKKELFTILDTIYEKTKYGFNNVRLLEKTEKPGLRKPWNFSYMLSGSFTKEEDPYFPFEDALLRWGRSFAALGIKHQGGKLVLDLLERDGKYNNGFCHWPDLVGFENGKRIPGRAQFTCNTVLGVPGQAYMGMVTLFHEGGHAAHLLNSDMKDVCLNHEYAPMSTAWAETQSQFLDTILSSIEWKSRYAMTKEGKPYPFDIYERKVKAVHAVMPLDPMGIMRICAFEKLVYEDKKLTAEKALTYAKRISKKFFDFSVDSITLLETPHLYSWESGCSYQGYLLAELALSQWRAYFFEKYGYIVDNPHVGKEMQRVWALGGSKTFAEFVKLATGKKLSASAYIKSITRSIPATLKLARERIATLEKKPKHIKPIDIDATVTMVHGKTVIADSKKGFEAMSDKYAAWLKGQYQK
jgi:Zn-dependent oligopeptidase